MWEQRGDSLEGKGAGTSLIHIKCKTKEVCTKRQVWLLWSAEAILLKQYTHIEYIIFTIQLEN